MVHVHRVGNEPAVIQGNLDVLCGCRHGECDRKELVVGSDGCRDDDIRGPKRGLSALQVRRREALDAELRDEGLARFRGEDRHLVRAATGDKERAVEEEKRNRVIQSRDGGSRELGPPRAFRFCRIIEKCAECGVRSELKALRAAVGPIDPEHGAIGKKRALDHAAAFGHGIDIPHRVGGLGGDDTACRLRG